MKSVIITLISALAIGGFAAHAQDYDDVYYSTSSKKAKTEAKTSKQTVTTVKANANPYYTNAKRQQAALSADTTEQVVNGRDVDEYNRRYRDDAEAYYAEEDSVATTRGDDARSAQADDFAYTDRIVKFHNADVIVKSDDPDLVEIYYNRPQVNLIVGSSVGFYDPWYTPFWGYHYAGWYDPFYYGSYWGGWGWHSPWYYSSWYDPCFSWGWGWHYPHYAGWYGHGWYGHGWDYGWGGRPYRARYSDYGRSTTRYAGAYGRGVGLRSAGRSANRPGYATSYSRSQSTGGATYTPAVRSAGSGVGRVTSRPVSAGELRRSNAGTSLGRGSSTGGRSSMGTATRSYSSGSSNSSRSYNIGSYSSGRSGGYSSGGGYSGGGRSSGGGYSGGGGGRGGRR